MLLVAMVSLLVNFWGENCEMRRKTRGKHLCKGRMITPSANMAYGNRLFVSLPNDRPTMALSGPTMPLSDSFSTTTTTATTMVYVTCKTQYTVTQISL